MKRFFIYCIVIIGAVFVGLAFYMFAKNNEVIDCTVSQGDTIYLNVGESFDIPINHTKKDKRTTIETKSDNSNIASINDDLGKIEARAGGTATITITPSNSNFGPFTFTLRIGDGSNENPYFVSTAEQLLRIGTMTSSWTLDDSYELVANIDLKERWVDGAVESWRPLGDSTDNKFTGNFNGGTKTISNLVIDESCTSNYVGLFGYVASGATVEKVTLVSPQIKVAGENVGAVAGYSEGSITRCKVVGGEITSTNKSACVGGIVGVSKRVQTENEIAMCSVDGVALNSANTVGGIAGKFVSGVIANCKANVKLATNKEIYPELAGGLIGEIYAIEHEQESKKFAYNSLIQTNLVIAQFGKNDEGNYLATTKHVMIAKDDLTGDSETEYVGNLFYCEDYDVIAVSTISANATRLTRQEVESQGSFKYTDKYSKEIAWDFVGTWSFEDKTEFDSIGPYIIQDGIGQNIKPLRNGSEVNKSNATDILDKLMLAGSDDIDQKYLGYTYVITEDIEIDFANSDWTPIGNKTNPFTGTIYGKDGAKLTLKNIKIPSSKIVASAGQKTAGIFGCTSNTAQISDINIVNLIIHSDENTYVGGMVGQNFGTLKNCSISGLCIKNGLYAGGIVGQNLGWVSNCEVGQSDTLTEIPEGQSDSVDVATQVVTDGKGTKYVGGIVGYNSSSVYCCEADILVEGTSSDGITFVGGVAGANADGGQIELCAKIGGDTKAGGSTVRLGGIVGSNLGTVTKCYSELSAVTATKNSNSYAGGVVGYQAGNISSSYFNGTLEGYYVGGIAGHAAAGTIEKCYSNASILASNKIGGLAYRCEATIKNCYFEALSQVQFAEGKKNDNVFAGLAVELPEGGYIENCYVSTTQGVSSNGENYLDVNTIIRSNITSFWTGLFGAKKYGSINNNVINSNGIEIGWWEKNIRKVLWSSKSWGSDSGWKFRTVDISGDGLLDGSVTSYFTSDCEFDPTIWDFSGSTPKLFGLDISGTVEDEFEETSINVALAEGAESNISLDGTVLKVTGFVAETPATITLDVTTENTDEVPTATLIEGDCVEVGAVADGKLAITVKALGNAKIKLELNDGTMLELTIEVVE